MIIEEKSIKKGNKRKMKTGFQNMDKFDFSFIIEADNIVFFSNIIPKMDIFINFYR